MIYGRDLELAALHAAYTAMLEGHGSVLFLTGEAGLGKTTLVHSWAASRDAQNTSEQQPTPHDSQPTTLFLESACSIPIGNVDVGRLEALQPWADVVEQLHEKLATDSNSSSDDATPADTNDKRTSQHKLDVRKLMRDAAPAWLWALPFVGEVAHAALVTARLVQDQRTGKESQTHSPTGPDPSSSPLSNNASATAAPTNIDRSFVAGNQEQVFQQYVNLLTKIAEATPIVIFLDDLHWADTSSCNLLFYLARQIAGKRILVIATYRQDDAQSANDGRGHAIITVKNEILRYSTGKELALSYLNRDAIRVFLSNTFTANNAGGTSNAYVTDDAFEQWLHKISDGNSLFMTQFVRTLHEDGHLDDHGKFVGDYATVVIPTTALAVVEERTRRLDADTRELLMYATAEGEEFTSYVLSQLTEKKPMQLVGELKKAQRIGMITDRGTSRTYANQTTAIFGFSHALFHKALYDQLTTYEQKILHGQCFEILKTEWDRVAESKSRTTTLATKLIAHAMKCEEWATVVAVALAAGQEFWNTYNEDEALAMIARVLTVSVSVEGDFTSERAEALFLRGLIGEVRGRSHETTNDFRAAMVLFESVSITDRAVDAANSLVWVLRETTSCDVALAEAARALTKAGAIGYRKGEAVALNNIGAIHADLCDYNEALSFYERSLAIATVIGHRKGEADLLMNIGIVHQDLSAYDVALAHSERSVAIHIAIGNRHGEANATICIGNIHLRRLEYDEALSHYERGLAIYTAIGKRDGEATALGNMGIVHVERGVYDEALSCFEQSLAICAATGNRHGEANTLGNMGCLLLELGTYDEALSHAERSLTICTAIGYRRGEAYALLYIGSVHQERGAHDEALLYYERSREIHVAIGNRQGEVHTLNIIGRAHRLLGNLSNALEYLERSIAIATEISSRGTVAEATAELGLVAEAESQTLAGAERDIKRTDALRLIEEAMVVFRELKLDKEVVKWEKELDRIKASP